MHRSFFIVMAIHLMTPFQIKIIKYRNNYYSNDVKNMPLFWWYQIIIKVNKNIMFPITPQLAAGITVHVFIFNMAPFYHKKTFPLNFVEIRHKFKWQFISKIWLILPSLLATISISKLRIIKKFNKHVIFLSQFSFI